MPHKEPEGRLLKQSKTLLWLVLVLDFVVSFTVIVNAINMIPFGYCIIVPSLIVNTIYILQL